MIVGRKRVRRKEAVFNAAKPVPAAGLNKRISLVKNAPKSGPIKSKSLPPIRDRTTKQDTTCSQKALKISEETVQDFFPSDTESLESDSDEEATPKKKTVVSPARRKVEKTTVKVVVNKCNQNLIKKAVPNKQKSRIARKQLFKSPQRLPDHDGNAMECAAAPSPLVPADKELLVETNFEDQKVFGKYCVCLSSTSLSLARNGAALWGDTLQKKTNRYTNKIV